MNLESTERVRQELTATNVFIDSGRLQLMEKIDHSNYLVVAGILDFTIEVAVKVIPLRDLKDWEHFHNEIRYGRLCECDNVVHLYGVVDLGYQFSEVGRAIGFVMERMEKSLASIVNAKVRLSTPAILSIAHSLLKGLSHMHQHKLIHRDIKPANVLIRELGPTRFEVKICDFDLVRMMTDEALTRRTSAIRGTLLFKAPEQFDADGFITQSADIWGFACTLFSLCTLSAPWPLHYTEEALLNAYRWQRNPVPHQNAEVSECEQLILRYCFRHDASERPTANKLLACFGVLLQYLLAREGGLHSPLSESDDVNMCKIVSAQLNSVPVPAGPLQNLGNMADPASKHNYWDLIAIKAQIPLHIHPTILDMFRAVYEEYDPGCMYMRNLDENGYWDEVKQIALFNSCDQAKLGAWVAQDISRSGLPYVTVQNRSLSQSIRDQMHLPTVDLAREITGDALRLLINKERYPDAGLIPNDAKIVITFARHDVRFVAPVQCDDRNGWIVPIQVEASQPDYLYYSDRCFKVGKEISFDGNSIPVKKSFRVGGVSTTLVFVSTDQEPRKWTDIAKWRVHSEQSCNIVSDSSWLHAVQPPEYGGYIVWGHGFRKGYIELAVIMSNGETREQVPARFVSFDFLTHECLLLRIAEPYAAWSFESITAISTLGYYEVPEPYKTLYFCDPGDGRYYWQATWDHRYPSFMNTDKSESERQHTLATRFDLNRDKIYPLPSGV